MADILPTLARCGDVTAADLAQIAGQRLEAVYEQLVHLEAAGKARMLARKGGVCRGFTWAAIHPHDCPLEPAC